MGKLVRAASVISAAFDCLVVLIHHCGIAGNRPRGHSSLSGADDAQIAVNRDKDGVITVTIEHMKDSEAGPPYGCRLEQVELGRDNDGDPITSCVAVPEQLPEAAESKPKGPKLSESTKLAYDGLLDVMKRHGQLVRDETSRTHGFRECPAVLWRERFYEVHPADKTDTKLKAFIRAINKLQELALAKVSGAKVLMPDN
jgi:hypothetical protein